MKIAFIIASINSKSNGLGGHYHSLLETAQQIAAHHEVFIINVGNNPAKALEDTKIKLHSVIFKGPAIFRTHSSIKKILKSEQPDILHAFDSLAYYWVRLAGHKLQIPFCVTKCGGINSVYFPYAKNLILFSTENLNFFKSKRKFEDSNLYLIPNRIKYFESDKTRIEKIKNNLGEKTEVFKFLRITRIGKYYHSSSTQLINLVNKLSLDGFKCCVIFIGIVEDKNCLQELRILGKDNCFFFTESEFTKDAKQLISVADAVLGTGRSFMEAAAKNKILLSPVQNSSIPIIITQKNFDTAFYYNFSERIKIENYNESFNYNKIKSIIQNKDEQTRNINFIRRIFNEYFNTDKIAVKYEKVYSNTRNNKIPKVGADFLLHTLFLIRNYYR
ncbi:glycosyltransferase [Algoriphagus marinus]|uniref:glycosyltransferase n=1 Tax=Algoriphagus marinus TaxID=1925762 RepID=UPI000A68DEFC|nr:glycosyltransferase [Algoriphagus marinus]